MTVKLGVLATAGKASQDDSTGAVIFIVGGIVLLVFIAAWITNTTRDRLKKKDINHRNNKDEKDSKGLIRRKK
jgi:hypothetical protein